MNKPFPLPDGFELDARGRFCGKPLKHWQREARKLVMDSLVRSMTGGISIIHAMANARLLEIAKAEDPEMLDEVLAERDRCVSGFKLIMQDILSR